MIIRNRTGSLSERRRQIEKNLEEGALGVSHSLEYQPTPYEEVLEYAKLAKNTTALFFCTCVIRPRKKNSTALTRRSGLRRTAARACTSIICIPLAAPFTWKRRWKKYARPMRRAFRSPTCVYPYSYWATYLYSKRFDPGWQQRYGLTFSDLRLVGSGERLTAQSFARYRKTTKLVAVPEGTMPLEKTVDLALKEDFCMIGSDGGIEYESHANFASPRSRMLCHRHSSRT